MNQLDFFIYSGIVNALTSFSLCAFVLLKGRPNPLNKSFAFFAFTVGYWAANYSVWLSTDNPSAALFFIRNAMAGAILIPCSFVHFSLFLLKKNKENKKFVLCNYLVCAFFLVFVFSNRYISGVESRFIFPHWPIPNFLFHLMLTHFVLNAVYAHYLLWRGMREFTGRLRQQVKYVFWGTFLGFAGGSTNFFIWYRAPIFPHLNWLVAIYVCSVAYAILRYKLLDIEIIVRRTLVFAGLFSFVFALFILITFLTQELLSLYVGMSRTVSIAIGVFAVVLAYDPLRRLLMLFTDRFLFQKKFNYQKLLRDASTGIGQIKSLKHLLNLVVHFVTMRVRVRSAAVLVFDEKNSHFKLLNPRGLRKRLINVKEYAVEPKDPLIAYMAERRTSLEIEQVKEAVEMGASKPKPGSKSKLKKREVQTAYDFKAIKERMEELEAGCCVPSFLGERLKNVLVLGEKKSGEFYTEQDLNVLYTLAQESAIAIENARLFDQAVERARELERINEALNRVQGDLVHALSETELANKRLRDTHVQLIHEQKMATLGRLAASVGHEVNNPLTILSMNVSRVILRYRKDPDLKVADVMEVFGKMEQNIARIKAVVNTLTGLLKKSEHGKFEPLSLKLVLEETLPLVQFQTYLENLSGTEVEFSIPSHLPLIKGDLERLQETFLNLFINAYHAMMGRPNRKISVTARANSNHPSMVTIEFSDNGCGMTDEVLKKIFNYGFTTKPPGKGSGMGLYMCRYIIELHGGEIKVRSHVGEGTTFVINLPAVLEGGGTRESSLSRSEPAP